MARSVFPLALSTTLSTTPYLALGMVVANLRAHQNGLLARHYDLRRLLPAGCPERPLTQAIQAATAEPDAICLLSSYVWNHGLNMTAAKRLKRRAPGCLVIVGGPEIPRLPGKTEAFLDAHPYVDVAVLGEGEITCAEVLEALATRPSEADLPLRDVDGVVFRSGSDFVRTPPRKRIKDPNELPSPYLTGEYGDWFRRMTWTVLETNRGCPYGCVYCDWGSATLQKIAAFAPERVFQEIEFIAERQAESIFVADANFGILRQDVEIAKKLAEVRERTGYPETMYLSFAKNGGEHLMEVIRILHGAGLLPKGILALQSTDPEVLETIERRNIKLSSYEKLMRFFHEQGIPMSSDLMIGLPGQTRDSVEGDLQFCFDWKVQANAFNTMLMPNAPMADPAYMEEHAIEVDDRRMVLSTSTFTAEDRRFMRALVHSYLFHVQWAVGKYLLCFLQVDHGVPAMRLLRRWVERAQGDDPATPIAARVMREIVDLEARPAHWYTLMWGEEAAFLFDDIAPFYEEIVDLAVREFGVQLEPSERRAIIAAQAAVMPKTGRPYPLVVELEHDVVAYFRQIRQGVCLRAPESPITPLRALGPGVLAAGSEGELLDSAAYREPPAAHRDAAFELRSELPFY